MVTNGSAKPTSWNRMSMAPPGDRNKGILGLSVDAFALTITHAER